MLLDMTMGGQVANLSSMKILEFIKEFGKLSGRKNNTKQVIVLAGYCNHYGSRTQAIENSSTIQSSNTTSQNISKIPDE